MNVNHPVFLSLFLLIISGSLVAQWQPTDGPYERVGGYDVARYGSLSILSTECGLFTQRGNAPWVKRSSGDFFALRVVDSLLFMRSRISWGSHRVNLDDPGFFIQSVSNHRLNSMLKNDTVIYAAAGTDGVQYTTDGGVHWKDYNAGLPADTMILSGNTPYYQYKVLDLVKTSQHLFAVCRDGIYRSNVSFSGWQNVTGGIKNVSVPKLSASNDSLYLTIRDSLYLSADQGQSWQHFYTAPYDVGPVVQYGGDLYLSGGVHRVLRSQDGGITWQYITNGLAVKDSVGQPSLWLKKSDGNLYASSVAGLFVLQGSQWKEVTGQGLFCNDPMGLAETRGQLLYSGLNGLSRKSGNTWTQLSTFPGRELQYGSILSHDTTVYVVAQEWSAGSVDSTFVIFSHDAGDTWSAFPGKIEGSNLWNKREEIYTKLYWLEGGLNITVGEARLFTSDLGQTVDDRSVSMLYCSNLNDMISYKNHTYMVSCKQNTVYRHNSGHIWDPLYTGLNMAGELEKFGSTDSALMVAGNSSLYISYDEGASWQKSTGFPAGEVSDFMRTKDRLYAAGSFGVYYTEDHGQSWQGFNNQLKSSGVDLQLFKDSIYLATNGGVLKHAEIPQVVDLTEDPQVGHGVEVYPNPASAYIYIEVRDAQQGGFRVLDASGRIVRSGEFQSGESLSLENLEAGVYLLVTDVQERTHRQKLIVQ